MYNENQLCKNKWPIIYLFSDDFAHVKEPRHSETKITPKEGIPLS